MLLSGAGSKLDWFHNTADFEQRLFEKRQKGWIHSDSEQKLNSRNSSKLEPVPVPVQIFIIVIITAPNIKNLVFLAVRTANNKFWNPFGKLLFGYCYTDMEKCLVNCWVMKVLLMLMDWFSWCRVRPIRPPRRIYRRSMACKVWVRCRQPGGLQPTCRVWSLRRAGMTRRWCWCRQAARAGPRTERSRPAV